MSIEKRAKGQLGQLLASAQGESVQAAVVSGSNPVECEVYIYNELAGYYKGRDPGHLERNIRYRLDQVGKKVELRVSPVAKTEEQPTATPESPVPEPGAESSVTSTDTPSPAEAEASS